MNGEQMRREKAERTAMSEMRERECRLENSGRESEEGVNSTAVRIASGMFTQIQCLPIESRQSVLMIAQHMASGRCCMTTVH
jgi:hypothetical protein